MNTYNIPRLPNRSRTYLKFVAYIGANPGLTRRQVMAGMNRRYGRGQLSDMWSALLRADFISYDEKFRYTITQRGVDAILYHYVRT